MIRIKTRTGFIVLWFIIQISLQPIGCERHYLLKYNGSQPTTKGDLGSWKCLDSGNCDWSNGWAYDVNKGGWHFSERNFRKDRCCPLETKPVMVPAEIFPSIDVVVVDFTVTFTECRPDRINQDICQEELTLSVLGADSPSFPIKSNVTDTNKDMTVQYSFELRQNTMMSVELETTSFVGVIKRLSLYYDYCQKSTFNLVQYPAVHVNGTSQGRCVENAVNFEWKWADWTLWFGCEV